MSALVLAEAVPFDNSKPLKTSRSIKSLRTLRNSTRLPPTIMADQLERDRIPLAYREHNDDNSDSEDYENHEASEATDLSEPDPFDRRPSRTVVVR